MEEEEDEEEKITTQVNLENDRDYLRIRFGLVPTASHRTFHRVKNQKSSFHSKNFPQKRHCNAYIENSLT